MQKRNQVAVCICKKRPLNSRKESSLPLDSDTTKTNNTNNDNFLAPDVSNTHVICTSPTTISHYSTALEYDLY